jgi:CHAD domain-containing protein
MIMHPEEEDAAFGIAVLQARSELLLSELAALKRRPTEKAIHDTRVQSRRLRAGLEAFRDLFPPYPWKAVYDSARSITRTLGKVRESEVILLLLKELTVGGDMAENLCREYLQERLQADIERLRAKSRKRLKDVQTKRLRLQIGFLISASGPGEGFSPEPAPGAARRGGHRQTSLFPSRQTPLERARRIIARLAEPVVSFHTARFRTAKDVQLHQLRIDVKKLRYAMEIFHEVWPGGLEEPIARAKALQDAAGQHQDWSVLRECLRAEIRRLTRQETTHLAFQMGRLLAIVEDRKAELRKQVLPAVLQLQIGLRGVLEAPARTGRLQDTAPQK